MTKWTVCFIIIVPGCVILCKYLGFPEASHLELGHRHSKLFTWDLSISNASFRFRGTKNTFLLRFTLYISQEKHIINNGIYPPLSFLPPFLPPAFFDKVSIRQYDQRKCLSRECCHIILKKQGHGTTKGDWLRKVSQPQGFQWKNRPHDFCLYSQVLFKDSLPLNPSSIMSQKLYGCH